MRAEVQTLYRNLIPDPDFKLDNKLLNYWANALQKGEKSADDFVAFVLNGSDYHNYMRGVYVDAYYELSSLLEESANVYTMFEDALTNSSGKPFTSSDARHHIVVSPQFTSGCAQVIKKLYTTIHNTDPSVELIEKYINMFVNNDTYTLDDLHDDIQKDNDNSANANTLNVSETENTSQETKSATDLVLDLECVDLYEQVFERGMNAREYLIFARDINNIPTKNAKLEYIKSLKNSIKQTYTEVQDVVYKYHNEVITEEDFIRSHLYRSVTSQGYPSLLCTEMIKSELYQEKMMQKLQDIYQTMYDDFLPDDDIEYLFSQVRALGIELMNEDLNQIVGKFQKDTDEIIESLFHVYMSVFTREPDNAELAMHIPIVRNTDDRESVLHDIAIELRKSLEYQDVIKNKIKKLNPSLKSSEVYRILEKALNNHRLSDDIDTHLTSLVASP